MRDLCRWAAIECILSSNEQHSPLQVSSRLKVHSGAKDPYEARSLWPEEGVNFVIIFRRMDELRDALIIEVQ